MDCRLRPQTGDGSGNSALPLFSPLQGPLPPFDVPPVSFARVFPFFSCVPTRILLEPMDSLIGWNGLAQAKERCREIRQRLRQTELQLQGAQAEHHAVLRQARLSSLQVEEALGRGVSEVEGFIAQTRRGV